MRQSPDNISTILSSYRSCWRAIDSWSMQTISVIMIRKYGRYFRISNWPTNSVVGSESCDRFLLNLWTRVGSIGSKLGSASSGRLITVLILPKKYLAIPGPTRPDQWHTWFLNKKKDRREPSGVNKSVKRWEYGELIWLELSKFEFEHWRPPYYSAPSVKKW